MDDLVQAAKDVFLYVLGIALETLGDNLKNNRRFKEGWQILQFFHTPLQFIAKSTESLISQR